MITNAGARARTEPAEARPTDRPSECEVTTGDTRGDLPGESPG